MLLMQYYSATPLKRKQSCYEVGMAEWQYMYAMFCCYLVSISFFGDFTSAAVLWHSQPCCYWHRHANIYKLKAATVAQFEYKYTDHIDHQLREHIWHTFKHEACSSYVFTHLSITNSHMWSLYSQYNNYSLFYLVCGTISTILSINICVSSCLATKVLIGKNLLTRRMVVSRGWGNASGPAIAYKSVTWQ